MIRTIAKALVDGTACAFPIWLISQVAVAFGLFVWPVFYVLAYWPLMVVSPFLPQGFFGDLSDAYTIDCIVSLVGWLILCNALSLVWYLFLKKEPPTDIKAAI